MKKIAAYKKKEVPIICPCCFKKQILNEAQLGLIFLKFGYVPYGKAEFLEGIKNNNKKFKWACDTCLTEGKAVEVNLEKQNTGYNFPIMVYLSESLKCNKCKSDFIFSAKEKKLWYENLGFYIFSIPIHCLSCRQKIRKTKSDNKKLAELLKTPVKDETILQAISEIYFKMGISSKGENFKRQAKNKRLTKN